MNDLIRKNDALDILCKFCGITEDVEKCRKTSADGWCKEYCELKNMPTVEAIPIEWIKEWIEEIKDHPAYTENEKALCIEEFEDMLGAWAERNEE